MRQHFLLLFVIVFSMGVTVTAQRQLIKQEVDRTTYDVQADNDSKTQTAMDMLRKVPMVTVDGEENILVRGNTNFKIYKNGHLDPSLTKNHCDDGQQPYGRHQRFALWQLRQSQDAFAQRLSCSADGQGYRERELRLALHVEENHN